MIPDPVPYSPPVKLIAVVAVATGKPAAPLLG